MSPRLLVVAGPNGSGKTSITEQLYELKHQWMNGCEYINPDNSITLQDGVIPEWTPLFRTENGKVVDKYSRPDHLWAQAIYDELKA